MAAASCDPTAALTSSIVVQGAAGATSKSENMLVASIFVRRRIPVTHETGWYVEWGGSAKWPREFSSF
jgi:hypothetical protein